MAGRQDTMMARSRRMLSAAVLVFAWVPTVVLALPSCCVNSTSGTDFLDDCVCLVDNVPLSGQSLAAGETRIYHWVLGMDNSALVSGSVRGNLTFEVAPCNGSASIDIKSGSPSSWPNLPSFNSSDDYNLASVTIPAKFTEQACLVTAGDVGATFDISVQTTLYDRPLPGNGGLLSAEMLSSGTARVLINTTENEAAGEVQYRLYWSDLPEADGACTAASENATLRENPNCLFWSACGLQNSADGYTDWMTLDANIGHVFEVAVDDDSSYLFNVAMMDARNFTSVYSGTNVSFSSTDYQDCVADPECTSQLNEDSTIVMIVSAAVTALALLIAGMKFLHTSIAKVMRDTVSSRSGQSYLGGGRALFGGKKNPKGKVHVENSFDGVDDSTPMVSPAKRPDRDPYASPHKSYEEVQDVEDSAESARLVQSEKSPNRQSPKRGSTVGSRSRSPRRPTARTDNDGDDPKEDDDNFGGSLSRKRSVAASPRSRNRRGGGGKGEEVTDEESDGSRAAPRSDIDNGGGKQWRTSVSGRAGQSSGTRTHKSPPASPSSRRESTRGRAASKASPKNSNYDDNEDDGEDNGASPRSGRKAVRKGDWEKQMARSNATQAQSRRRRTNAEGDAQESVRRRRKRDDGDEESD